MIRKNLNITKKQDDSIKHLVERDDTSFITEAEVVRKALEIGLKKLDRIE